MAEFVDKKQTQPVFISLVVIYPLFSRTVDAVGSIIEFYYWLLVDRPPLPLRFQRTHQ